MWLFPLHDKLILKLQTKKTNICYNHAPLFNSGKELGELLLTIKIRLIVLKKKFILDWLLLKLKVESGDVKGPGRVTALSEMFPLTPQWETAVYKERSGGCQQNTKWRLTGESLQ